MIKLADLFDASGRPVPLGHKLGSGGEGDVYEVTAIGPDLAAKIYHKPLKPDKQEKLRSMVQEPTFKGSECPYRIFGLRALYTTRGRGLEHHRPAGDGVGHPRAARPLGHLSIIGPGLLV